MESDPAALKEHKVSVSRTPDDVLRKQLETWDKIRETEAGKDPFFKKVVDSHRQYAATVVQGRVPVLRVRRRPLLEETLRNPASATRAAAAPSGRSGQPKCDQPRARDRCARN
jgi:hypothetical protein